MSNQNFVSFEEDDSYNLILYPEYNLPLSNKHSTNSTSTFDSIAEARNRIGAASEADLQSHVRDTSNPHQVSAEQVGAVSSTTFDFTKQEDGAVLVYNASTGKYNPITQLYNLQADGGWF